MEKLIVKKGGFLEKQIWIYNDVKKKGKYTNIKIKRKTSLFYLNKYVELESGFTVRDWFKLVINYPFFQKLDCFMHSYLEEYNTCPQSGCFDPENKIGAIALQKIIVFDDYKNDHNYNYNSCIFIDVFGQTKDEIHYGIDFLHLKNYLDIPMKLLYGISYREKYNKGGKKGLKIEKPKHEIINVYYTLFDLISSFIYEISFHGTPKQRDEKINELKEMVERIKRGEEKMVEMKFGELWWGKEDDS